MDYNLSSVFGKKSSRSSPRTARRRSPSSSPQRDPPYTIHGDGGLGQKDQNGRSSSSPRRRKKGQPKAPPMDIVFSLDTTYSMLEALEDVKEKVQGMVKKLLKDIPGIQIGVIAHGDYYCKDPYVIRVLPLTNSVKEATKFLSELTVTAGYDFPECYELALRKANAEMPWRPGSKRILVVIGDSWPHEPDYGLNEDNIDWRQEAQELRDKSVTIYAVQFENHWESTAFFEELTRLTGGRHLYLTNTTIVSTTIMAICYKEQGLEMLLAFEREIIRMGGGVSGDLENLFNDLKPKTNTPRRRPLTDKEKEKSFVLDCVASNSLSRGYVIPEYDAQNDPALAKYFRSTSVRKILLRTAQAGGSRSRPGTSRDPSPERLLSLRNQSGAGHSDDTVAGHGLFMDGSMSARDFCGYNGEGGYRRNTPWLRANPSSFRSAPPVGHHQDVPKH